MVALDEQDQQFLRLAIAVSRRSRANGNHDFGAQLADSDGAVLEEQRTRSRQAVIPPGMRRSTWSRVATTTLPPERLATSTLYSSAEPCARCAGAIYWGGHRPRRLRHGRDVPSGLTGPRPENPTLELACRVVFATGQRAITVVAPAPTGQGWRRDFSAIRAHAPSSGPSSISAVAQDRGPSGVEP
jgi:tRNA(Arg) A34 adenosine deaminase TadA